MTHTALSATDALRRAAECVLMAFGVPVTRDMPADAVFLPMDDENATTKPKGAFAFNPATGAPMVGAFDALGYAWGEAPSNDDNLDQSWIDDFDR